LGTYHRPRAARNQKSRRRIIYTVQYDFGITDASPGKEEEEGILDGDYVGTEIGVSSRPRRQNRTDTDFPGKTELTPIFSAGKTELTPIFRAKQN